MYTAVQLLQFFGRAPAASPPAATYIPDVFATTSNKSSVLTLYTDPKRPEDAKNTGNLKVYYLHNVEEWGKILLVFYVLQGLGN
jgi:hypothetical protein